MHSTRYLIVGAGMTGDAAAASIREHDSDGAITIVGAEPYPPYKRPPLSKGLWQGAPEEKIWRRSVDGVEIVTGRRIVSIDHRAHRATDDAGTEYTWERLLLATGAQPRRVPGWEGVVWFRTLDDYREVRELAQPGTRAVVVGGGFIGSELAAALAGVDVRVTMVFPEPGIAWRTLPADLSLAVGNYYVERGVEVLSGETVTHAEAGVVRIGSGRSLEADLVVAGLGVVPADELARTAGLPVADGVVVDEYGRVAGRDDVFAAGDVASFPLAVLGGRARVEHEDHANTHGRVVGANMAGAGVAYDHLPFFYSDLFDLGYEAVGAVDSLLEAVEDWQEPFRKGVVTYLEDGRPRGVLLWNVWDKLDEARDLILAGEGALAV